MHVNSLLMSAKHQNVSNSFLGCLLVRFRNQLQISLWKSFSFKSQWGLVECVNVATDLCQYNFNYICLWYLLQSWQVVEKILVIVPSLSDSQMKCGETTCHHLTSQLSVIQNCVYIHLSPWTHTHTHTHALDPLPHLLLVTLRFSPAYDEGWTGSGPSL